jgi:hypothetical protein
MILRTTGTKGQWFRSRALGSSRRPSDASDESDRSNGLDGLRCWGRCPWGGERSGTRPEACDLRLTHEPTCDSLRCCYSARRKAGSVVFAL